MGLSTNEFLGVAVILAVGLVAGGFAFSGASTNDVVPQMPADGDNSVETGVSADLSLAAYDRTADSATQVAPNLHVWETSEDEFYLGEQSASTSDRTAFSLVTGDDYKAIGFNSQYPYASVVEGDVDSETVRENLDVYEGAATSDISLTVNDENGDSTTGISALGSEEQYQFDSMELSLDNSNVGYNPHVITVGYPDNISNVDMPGAQEVDVPETASDTVSSANEVAFVPSSFNAQEGEPMMQDWDSVDTEGLVVEADTDGTGTGDSLEIAVQDKAPFITQANGLEYGVEDDASNPTDNGVSAITQSITLG